MRKAIKENFKYIYLMMSLIMVIILGSIMSLLKQQLQGFSHLNTSK